MKKLLSFLVIAVLALSLTACGDEEETIKIVHHGPIAGWAAVALPDDSTWARTIISGPVENHNYDVAMSRVDFFAYLEISMEENSWLLDSSFKTGRYFINEAGDFVSYTTNQEQAPLNVLVIIEPAGTYDNVEAEESPLENDEETTTESPEEVTE